MQTLTQAVVTAKIVKKLFLNFSKAADGTKTDLLNETYFDKWVRDHITLPATDLACDRYTFKTVGSQVMTPETTVLMPLALASLLSENCIKPEITKSKKNTYRLSFIYQGSTQVHTDLETYAKALHLFEQFKVKETLQFYLGLTTKHEQNLFSYLIGSTYTEGEVKNDGHFYPTKEDGKQTWQYTCWLRLVKDLKKDFGDGSVIRTTDGKFIAAQLLDYQRFYPLITRIKSRCVIPKAILIINFFDDAYIKEDTLVYLPKRFIQSYTEYQDWSKQSFSHSSGKYRVRAKDCNTLYKHLGSFPTLEEAREAYRVFKLNVVKELFNYYRPHICPEFCLRFNDYLTDLGA